jgi:LacI family transcriptional regulator
MPKRRKLVTIKDIAKEAKCSIASVSFAMNEPDRVSPNTRRHILRIARESGYSRVKKLKNRGTIGLVADDYYNLLFGEFYNMVVLGILEELKKRNFNVLIDSTGKDPEYFPKMITKSKVDGVLFLGKCSRDIIYIAQQKNIPVVLVGHPIPDVEIHTVVPDGRSGAFQAMNHLIELGHKKIAMITGEPMYDPITSERVEGYRFALAQAGIPDRKEYIAEADFGKPKTAHGAADKLLSLSEPPTAIFCASDSLAYRAYEAIKDKSLKIPGDISVVGFDEITAPEYALLPKPELTTVQVDRRQMGKNSVEILFNIIQNPVKTAYRYTLPVKLVIKESTSHLKNN